MSIFAGKTRFTFPGLSVDLSATGQTETPVPMRAALGPLSALSYKPAIFKYNLVTAGSPVAAIVSVKLMAGTTELFSNSKALNGVANFGESVSVDLTGVSGSSDCFLQVDVTTLEAGKTLAIDACLDVELPVTLGVL